MGGALVAAILAGEILRAWAGWSSESSRRFVHTSVGVMVALAPPLFARPAHLYALAGLFVVVNAIALPRRLLRGIHDVRRPTWGTVVFPIALIVGLALTWSIDAERTYALRAAFLVLALADPVASIMGERAGSRGAFQVSGHRKTVAGSATFFVAATVLCAVALVAWGSPNSIGYVVAAAVVAAGLATAAEALGTRGWDNLWIVLAVVVSLLVVELRLSPLSALLSLIVAIAFGATAWRMRALDVSGALAAVVLAWVVLAPADVAWAAPGLTFFLLSSMLSRVGRRRKAAAESLAEKSGPRDAGQVLANGGVAGALIVAFLLVPDTTARFNPALYWGMVGAFAAAAADTWATEVGTLVGGRTRLLPTFRIVPPGSSGGVSVAGTAAALAGAMSVFLAAWITLRGGGVDGAIVPLAAALTVGGAMAACILDSVLGGTLQARHRLPNGNLTERAIFQGRGLPLAAGLRGMNNDLVNLACTLAGAAIPFAAFAPAGPA